MCILGVLDYMMKTPQVAVETNTTTYDIKFARTIQKAKQWRIAYSMAMIASSNF